MLVLGVEVHETIWGGKKLTPYSNTQCEKIGHLYSVNCSGKSSNLILNGEYKGKTLNEYFEANKKRFGMEQYDYFPLVIALVEADDNLSIQVHPDDEIARILNPKIRYGKNESWFFIEEPENGTIYDGCLCKSMEELKSNIIVDSIECVTRQVEIRKGDYIYIEAGTLHAMTKGSLVYEIEENAGDTYRFYDFNRTDNEGKKRPLHISEAFFAIHLEKESKIKHYTMEPIEERKYITQYYENIQNYENKSNTLQVLTLLSDKDEVCGMTLTKGMSVILEPGEKISMGESEVIIAQPRIE